MEKALDVVHLGGEISRVRAPCVRGAAHPLWPLWASGKGTCL